MRGEIQAVVTSVEDGDTLTVRIDGATHRVRLSDIDAPEVAHCAGSEATCLRKGQRFGQESRDHLASMVMGRTVHLACWDQDARYGRSVCRVFVGSLDVNREQVKAGLAWFNKKYSKDKGMEIEQSAARRARRGLWEDAYPVAPWLWRENCWKRGLCDQ